MDYSESGNAWDYFTHDQARSRAYRWGEDGRGGISDDRQLLCFALALWNGRDPGLQDLFSIGPQVRLPIFNSGRTPAGVTSAKARAEAAVSQYKQTIQQAFREVADALVEQRKRREFRLQQEALTRAAEDTSRLANMRYTGGYSSYLEILDSERQFFDAEPGLVRAHRDELLAVVRLYKALGGGWQE